MDKYEHVCEKLTVTAAAVEVQLVPLLQTLAQPPHNTTGPITPTPATHTDTDLDSKPVPASVPQTAGEPPQEGAPAPQSTTAPTDSVPDTEAATATGAAAGAGVGQQDILTGAEGSEQGAAGLVTDRGLTDRDMITTVPTEMSMDIYDHVSMGVVGGPRGATDGDTTGGGVTRQDVATAQPDSTAVATDNSNPPAPTADEALAQADAPAAAPAHQDPRTRASQAAAALLASVTDGFMGPCGLVAICAVPTLAADAAARVSWRVVRACEVREGVREAAQFAREWRELRAITRSRLQGKVLTATLQVQYTHIHTRTHTHTHTHFSIRSVLRALGNARSII